MGRSYKLKYYVTYRDNTMSPAMNDNWITYDSKRHGKPTDAVAENIRKKLNESFAPDGVNYHVSTARGVVIHVTKLKIIRQSDDAVMGEATAPMFEVV